MLPTDHTRGHVVAGSCSFCDVQDLSAVWCCQPGPSIMKFLISLSHNGFRSYCLSLPRAIFWLKVQSDDIPSVSSFTHLLTKELYHISYMIFLRRIFIGKVNYMLDSFPNLCFQNKGWSSLQR